MKNKAQRLKNHVSRHRAKYAAASTAVVITTGYLKLQMYNAETLNAFLEKHDLLDEYYQMNEI
jgi:hypothetical protein